MNRQAHSELAFRYSCFESGSHTCDIEEKQGCGTDTLLYQAKVEIPKCYPDGDYVLSWAWFGGLSMGSSLFGDYYSCSFVQIQGGEKKDKCEPRFQPGENTRKPDSCYSSVGAVGICEKEPCLGRKGKAIKPSAFLKPQTSLPIQKWIDYANSLKDQERGESKGVAALSEKSGPHKGSMSRNVTLIPSPSPLPSHRIAPSPTPIKRLEDVPVKILGLRMVNTDNSEVMAEEFMMPIFVNPDISNFTFVALTSGKIRFVTFYVNKSFVRREGMEPYACWGDTRGKFKPWPIPVFGTVEVRVEARGKNGSGDTRTFTIRLVKLQEQQEAF
ncbi:unnamed protein product [Chondrus crispus]|uniref:Uncharacterized protein n=1 Tax=Chondrus crispus TaxID=2769 RepID=R7QFV8_CHOCR|nr:unnamed protein product [Chondrus crispus]CDF36341.1 unnamed protein product [Chondrus crispus]|eukprot:XP_005716160.1 unnamed protein product [Chondrus crispus]